MVVPALIGFTTNKIIHIADKHREKVLKMSFISLFGEKVCFSISCLLWCTFFVQLIKCHRSA